MPIASRAAAMVAGILGGSGTHVVQIIIAIVVAAALIGYFLVRLGGRGGGGVRAATAAVSQPDRDIDRAHEGAVSDATLRLVRTWSGIGIGAQSAQWSIAIDGTVVGSIAHKETVEVSVEPGHHVAARLRQAPQCRAVVRCRAGRGRRLPVPRSEDMADVGGGAHQPRPMDFAPAGVRSVRRCVAGMSSSAKVEQSSSRRPPSPRTWRLEEAYTRR